MSVDPRQQTRKTKPAFEPQRKFYTFAILALIVSVLSAPASAQADPLAQTHLKDGATVRHAFRDVVSDSRQSTVRILSSGRQTALGTVVDPNGWVLTKASQIFGTVVCEFPDDTRYRAEIVGVNHLYDLAILKIDAQNLKAITWRTGNDPEVGDWLATPGLSELPIAVGVVSVKRRSVAPMRGLLGITFEDRNDKAGPVITRIQPRSSAERAGLLVGDAIKMVSGKTTEDGIALRKLVGEYRPGDSVVLRIVRGDQEFDILAVLENPLAHVKNKSTIQNRWGGELSVRRRGFDAVLQHDTVLSPEDCGGPIVDLNGHAIGMNIARAGRTESFALPANVILPLIEELKSGRLQPLKPVLTWKPQTSEEPTELGGSLIKIFGGQPKPTSPEEMLRRRGQGQPQGGSSLGQMLNRN